MLVRNSTEAVEESVDCLITEAFDSLDAPRCDRNAATSSSPYIPSSRSFAHLFHCSVILSVVVSYPMMTTTTTGLLRGATIELESAVPEMDGQRVRVVLEPVEEQRLSTQQQRELWRVWLERGPEGPIEDGIDTDIP